jgi:hypothetical protein
MIIIKRKKRPREGWQRHKRPRMHAWHVRRRIHTSRRVAKASEEISNWGICM